jgi:hypothetical protein
MSPRLTVSLCAPVALLLAACGSGDAPVAPKVSVTELAAGVHRVSSGDPDQPVVGSYHAAADGSALVILNDAEERAAKVYRRDGKDAWQAAPGVGQDSAVTVQSIGVQPALALSPASLAGRYVLRLGTGATAVFTLNAAGEIAAAEGGCKLSGKASPSALPQVLALTLNASGCGTLAATSEGWLVVDRDYAPASFRLVTSAAGKVSDLWAYAE